MYCVVSAPGQDRSFVEPERKLLSGVSVELSSAKEQVPFKGLYDTLWHSGTSSHEFMQL
jgi:hypothetical protein